MNVTVSDASAAALWFSAMDTAATAQQLQLHLAEVLPSHIIHSSTMPSVVSFSALGAYYPGSAQVVDCIGYALTDAEAS